MRVYWVNKELLSNTELDGTNNFTRMIQTENITLYSIVAVTGI